MKQTESAFVCVAGVARGGGVAALRQTALSIASRRGVNVAMASG